MFLAMRVITKADQELCEWMANSDLSWFGRSMKVMLGGCRRTVPFENINVVARVGFLCTLGVYTLCTGSRVVSHDIGFFLHRFAKRKIAWGEFVEACIAMQNEMELSEQFCNDALCFFRGHASFWITFIEGVPGDIEADAGYLQLSDQETIELQPCTQYAPTEE